MKKTVFLTLVSIALCALCPPPVSAQNAKNYNHCRIGIGAGVIFPQEFGDMVDQTKKEGFEQMLGIGGQLGFDLHIPLYKGLFLKPAVYGAFTRSGYEKSTHKETQGSRLDLDTFKRYDITETIDNLEQRKYDWLGLFVPVTLGYEFRYAKRVSFFLGATGFMHLAIDGKYTDYKKYSRTVVPDKYGQNGTTESSDGFSLTEGVEFKDRFDYYGVGGQAGMRVGKMFLHYTVLYNLHRPEDYKQENLFHTVTLGIYFN